MPVRNIGLRGNKFLQRINRRRKLVRLNIALRFLQQIIQRIGNLLPPCPHNSSLSATLTFVGRILSTALRISAKRQSRRSENRGNTQNNQSKCERGYCQLTTTPQSPRPRRTKVRRTVPHP